MRKVRAGVFETNSSAVHCLVMPEKYIEKSNLKITRGKIKVSFLNDDFEFPCDTQESKLSYLITQIAYKNCGWNWRDLEEDYEYKTVKEFVCDYTGAKDIKIDYSTEPGINHQAQWGDYTDEFVDTCDRDSVISFIFSPVMVKEYRD